MIRYEVCISSDIGREEDQNLEEAQYVQSVKNILGRLLFRLVSLHLKRMRTGLISPKVE